MTIIDERLDQRPALSGHLELFSICRSSASVVDGTCFVDTFDVTPVPKVRLLLSERKLRRFVSTVAFPSSWRDYFCLGAP